VKKLVAFSTMGQMGFILLAVGVGAVDAGFFHLLCHALYKSLLFICVGVLIHSVGVQDMRYLAGFNFKSPVLVAIMSVSLLSLIGFPFLSGFYSKDLILEFLLIGRRNVFVVGFVFVSVVLGSMCRCRILLVFGSSRAASGLQRRVKLDRNMIVPCYILMVGRLVGGYAIQASLPNIRSGCN
jgi:NADH-quinone oxidoreductase subunit L